ncbi:FANCD2 opposite strand, partial [Chelydra serpentina]
GYQLWAPWSPLDESLQWLRGATPRPCTKHPFRPQAVRLSGLDSVFGRLVTAQPPRWTGSFRVSERSAFCQVISPRQRWPRGLREPQVRMAVAMCRQMLRAILLLYAAYKKCAFALQHSR